MPSYDEARNNWQALNVELKGIQTKRLLMEIADVTGVKGGAGVAGAEGVLGARDQGACEVTELDAYFGDQPPPKVGWCRMTL
jgi:hypothetical protein